MYMAREIFHCKPGKAKDVVAKFKKLSVVLREQGYGQSRICTDVSGENYWTVVVEQDIEKIDGRDEPHCYERPAHSRGDEGLPRSDPERTP